MAYDSEAGIIKNYRVDKMDKITTFEARREGREVFRGIDMAVYGQVDSYQNLLSVMNAILIQ